MTNEMQDYRPNDPPPPPPAEHAGGYYSPWSADPTWGPPTWPPSQQAPRGTGFRRTALAVFAIACVGAGGGTAWALTTTSASSPSNASNPSGSTGTGQNPGGSISPSTGSLSAATIAKLNSSVVDINADEAGGAGEVAGTGMIITSNGEVLTNNHVIDDTVNIRAQIDGTGTVYQVKVIGYDASDDVALVQLVGASGLPTIPIGDSSALTPRRLHHRARQRGGQGWNACRSHRDGLEPRPEITASDDSGDNETLTGMLQVNAAIQPGNSGGPEINSNGKVIGMTTAGQTSGNPNAQTSTTTTGFAIPINKAMEIITEIRNGSGPHIHIGYRGAPRCRGLHQPAGDAAELHHVGSHHRRLGERGQPNSPASGRPGRVRTDHRHRRRLRGEPERPPQRDGRLRRRTDRDAHLAGLVGAIAQRHDHPRDCHLPRLSGGTRAGRVSAIARHISDSGAS